jgi:hypothetical protein
MRGRRVIEQQQEQAVRISNSVAGCANVVDCPGSSDVVFKTGTSNSNHPGNSVFHEMLLSQSDESHIATVTLNIVFEDVMSRNGRFLEWDSGGYWRVLSDSRAIRQKIYRSFFHAKKSSNARKRRQDISSSTFLFERQDGRKTKRIAYGTEMSSCIETCIG